MSIASNRRNQSALAKMNKQLMLKNILKKIHNISGIDTYFSKIVENFLQIAYFFLDSIYHFDLLEEEEEEEQSRMEVQENLD